MMPRILKFLLLSGCFVCLASNLAYANQQVTLEIFSDHDIPIPTIRDVTIIAHNMNAIARVQAEMAPQFKGNTVEDARKKAEAWIRSPAYQDYAVHRDRIFLPLRRIAQFQIAKIPAVLINEKYIIYGTSDPRTALDDYHRYLAARSLP